MLSSKAMRPQGHLLQKPMCAFFMLILFVLLPCAVSASPLSAERSSGAAAGIVTGADQPEEYFPYIRNKRIGMVVNPTSIIGKNLSVDYLWERDINILRIFGPEHGFRGDQDAGKAVADYIDPITGIPVISLYGAKQKPTPKDLEGIDVMLFDIQDVGARFYTYVITMHNVMEACAENGVEVMILDRPNPNGHVVDGPILDMSLKSGIGRHPVPIAHGLTIGEYAQMINGEGWLADGVQCKLRIVKVKNYARDMVYNLPVKPSPNLNTDASILLYPSTCLFEGTVISQGRGTYLPFTILGNPLLKGKFSYSFTPVNITGMSETPLFVNETCYGLNLNDIDMDELRRSRQINLKWLCQLFDAYPLKIRFFDRSQSRQIGDFNLLAGTRDLMAQIVAKTPEADIRASWEPKLGAYKTMRVKYMLYP